MRRTAISIMTVLLGGLATAAPAGGLAEARARGEADSAIASEADFTSSVCGTSIGAAFDWDTFDDAGRSADEDAVDDCDGALGAIESFCRDDGESAVADNIDEVVCEAGGGPDVSLSGGTLIYTLGGDGYDAVADFLESALGG